MVLRLVGPRWDLFFNTKRYSNTWNDRFCRPNQTRTSTRARMRCVCTPFSPRRRWINPQHRKTNVWRRRRTGSNYSSIHKLARPASRDGATFSPRACLRTRLWRLPRPAAAQLFSRGGISIGFDGHESVTIPSFLASANAAGKFVAENAPIPVAQLSVTEGVSLKQYKWAVITSFTREVALHTSLEQVVRQVLSEVSSLALDSAAFSTTAATSTTPGGILFGATPIAGAAGATQGALSAESATLLRASLPLAVALIRF